jgi:cell division transport system permease protein
MAKKKNAGRPSGLGYFIREGLRGIASHKFMSFAAVGVIAACLLVTATFSLVAYNIGRAVDSISSQSEVLVYVDETYTRDEAVALEILLEALDNVKDAVFVSREEAFADYLETLGDDAYIMEDLIENNPLRDGYRIFLKDVSLHEETVAALEKVEGIADASSSREVFQRLVQIRRVVDIVSATLVAMLGAVSVFIIANTVKLAMFARRDEIGIMKMVGATNRFIRAPFVVEGMLLGMCAAGLAFLAQWGVYEYIAQQLSAGTGVLTLLPFEEFRYGLALLLVGAGLVFGIGGSTITIRKFMKV